MPQATGGDKLPVPEAAVQKEKEKLIREIMKEEYGKAAPADKLALSKKLLQQGAETQDDPATRFVLFRESRDLAAEAGDAEASLKAIDSMAAGYAIAPLPMKVAALTTAGKMARSPEDLRRLAGTLLSVAEEALAAEEYDIASQLTGSAGAAAKRAKDMPLATKAEAKSREVTEIKARFDTVRKAKEKLATSPADPAANLTVGQYLCFVKGDWASGLPLLAQGADAGLKELAGKDLAKPGETSDQLALGDGWWDLAEKGKGKEKETLRRRAVFWYEQAAPRLSGLQQAKVNQRLTAAAAGAGGPEVAATGLFGYWKLDEGSGAVASDSSGNKRHGKIDGPAWAKGRIGGALSFNGEQNRVNIDAGEVPPPWTAAMWVKREDSPNPTGRLMDSATSGGSSLRLEQSLNTRRVGITKYAVVDHAFTYSAPAGTWVHLTFVGTDKAVSLYANGALVDSVTLTVPLLADKLGSHGAHSLKGCLDEVRVYTRALTPKEIETLGQSGKR